MISLFVIVCFQSKRVRWHDSLLCSKTIAVPRAALPSFPLLIRLQPEHDPIHSSGKRTADVGVGLDLQSVTHSLVRRGLSTLRRDDRAVPYQSCHGA